MNKIWRKFVCCFMVCLMLLGVGLPMDFLGTQAAASGNMPEPPENMKINLKSEPLGISREDIRFSWSFQDADADEMQTAYHIVVSDSLSHFQQGDYIFDSGWVEDSRSAGVLVSGLSDKLEDNSLYYWAVQVKDTEGLESGWSEPQCFITAVGDEWKSRNGIWGSSEEKFVFLRQELMLRKPVEKVVASVAASSTEETQQFIYQFYVNGSLVGLGPADQNGEELYYDTYDITSLLGQGENALGAVCYSENDQGFLCQITAFYEDGTKEILSNSGAEPDSWQAMDADSVFGYDSTSIANYYTANRENLNGQLYPAGWNQVGFSSSQWAVPRQTGDLEIQNSGRLSPYPSGTVSRYEQPAASVTRLRDGSYVIDLGKEIIGSIRLTVNSPESRTVQLSYGEEKNSDGSVKSRMRTGNVYEEKWTLKQGEQSLEGIGMKCFRYVQVKNWPYELSADNITGLTIRQEFNSELSGFSSSNELLNQIYELTKYTIQTTSQSRYVDSQSRERCTYEGDALVQMMSSFTFQDDYTLARHTLDYAVNHLTWPAEYQLYLISAAWQEYLYTGDSSFLEENYARLKALLYDSYYDAGIGLVKKPNKTLMIDWPYAERDGYEVDKTVYNTAFNSVCSAAYRDMGRIASALGYQQEAQELTARADGIKQALINKLYDPATGRFYDGLDASGAVVNHCAQHASAYALACGIYSDGDMASEITASIRADGTIRTSVYASYFLLEGLYQGGDGLFARQLMTNPDTEHTSNSWAYMIDELGATLTTEAWSPQKKSNMSFSHAWGSAPASQIARGIFGIRPTEPGFSQFQVKLQPGGLARGSIRVPTVKGEIPVSFALDGAGTMTAALTVPANTQAELLLPAGTSGNTVLTVNGSQVTGELTQGYVKILLGSGEYQISYVNGLFPDETELTVPPVVKTVSYVEGQHTWKSVDTDGALCGTEGQGFYLSALRFTLNGNGIEGGITSSVRLQADGWQEWKQDGETHGTPESQQPIEAVRLKLTGQAAEEYDVYYRVHSQSYGWQDWAKNGEIAGTVGLNKHIEAIQVRIIKKDGGAPGSTEAPFAYQSKDILTYQTHVETYGWQGDVSQNEVSGTVGQKKRLEAIRINVASSQGGVRYRTHVQSYGWQDWASDGENSGTQGERKRLEAIQIELTGDLAKQYDIYYRVHIETYGWLGWVRNGDPAGSEGLAKRLEGIQITLVEKGGPAPGSTGDGFIKDGPVILDGVNYQTHVQSDGWQSWRHNGETSGTQGERKRLEGIRIQLQNAGASGNIEYQTHVQSYGWQNWVSNGQISGTMGQSKRLEAIRIRLTGALSEKYDIYYRVHAETYGWLDWAKNGAEAGTEGLAKRLEAIEIQLVEKGGPAPGSEEQPFVKAPPETVDGVNYRTHVQSDGWKGWKANGALSGTSGQAKRLEAIRIMLQNPEYAGSIEYRTHVQSYGWQNWVKDGQDSGTSGQAKRLEGIEIRLTGELAEHYDVYYRVHVQTYGWQDWVKNGETAGTTGQAKRLEAIEIKLVQKEPVLTEDSSSVSAKESSSQSMAEPDSLTESASAVSPPDALSPKEEPAASSELSAGQTSSASEVQAENPTASLPEG